MKQTGLIQRVIEAVGLDDGMVKGEFKPSEKRNLLKNSDGEPPSGIFSCFIFLACLSTFQVILVQIYNLLSISLRDTCLVQIYIMTRH